MMGDVRQFLEKINVSEDIINSFLDNDITTVEDLQLLSEEDLAQLVTLIGPRNRVKAAIAKLGSNQTESCGITLNDAQTSILDALVTEEETVTVENVTTVEEAATLENDTINIVKATSAKRKKTSVPTHSYDLEDVLESAGGAGELILNVYRANSVLSDSNRSSLAKIIINYETAGDFGRCVTKERALFLAKKVVERFPTELLSTWYRVETRANGTGKMVKGRIIRRYYTQRKIFKKLGVINSNSDSEDDEENLDGELESDADETSNDSLTWLANKNLTPWPRVLDAWKNTSKRRMKDLQKPVVEEIPVASKRTSMTNKRKKKQKRSQVLIIEYTQQFPQVAEPQGWTLLEIDFECLYESAPLKMDLGYQKLEKFVIHKLRTINPDFLFDDFDLKPQSERSAFIFLSISQLFPVTTVANLKQAHWRPSRQEMRDSFILQAKSHGDLRTLLEARQTKLQKFNLHDQPLPVIIKEKLQNKTKLQCCVQWDNILYNNLESPIKAVDIAFKSYHALHAFYPPESEPIWLFLQKAVYGFSSKWDKEFDAVNRLVQEYSKFNP